MPITAKRRGVDMLLLDTNRKSYMASLIAPGYQPGNSDSISIARYAEILQK